MGLFMSIKANQRFVAALFVLTLALTALSFLSSAALAAAPWYDSNWGYRHKITIKSGQITGTQTNFPMLVNSTIPGLAGTAQPDGDDILFTGADGTTKLDHEIEGYTSGTGELIAWVRVPSASVGTEVYMYYGNSGTSNQENKEAVWDANYKVVYHLDDKTTSTIDDSTINSKDGTKAAAGNPAEGAGQIGRGQVFNGSSDYVLASLGAVNATFTVEAWGYFNQLSQPASNYDYILAMGTGANMISFSRNASDNRFYSYSESAQKYGPVLAGQAWTHIVGVYNRSGTFHNLYINGSPVSVDAFSAFMNTNGDLVLGEYPPSSTHWLDGKVDEVRVSDAARSANWIDAEYKNQNAPGAFYDLGSQELLPATPATGVNTPTFAALAITALGAGFALLRRRTAIPLL